jgi:hypothetical protein
MEGAMDGGGRSVLGENLERKTKVENHSPKKTTRDG